MGREPRPGAASFDVREGSLRFTWSDVSPFGQAISSFPGGKLVVDPGVPGAVLALEVDDLVEAGETIERLLGHRGLGAVHAAVSSLDFDALVSVAPTRNAEAMCRLAFAGWNHRWTPLDVGEDDMQLDLATASFQAGDPDTAREIFTNNLGYLVEVSSDFRGMGASAARAVFQETLRAAIWSLPGSAERSELERASSRISHQDKREAGLILAGMEDMLTDSRLVKLGADPAAGRTHPRGQWVRDSVDWTLVPRGLVSASEGAVVWREEAGAVVCRVDPHPSLLAGQGRGQGLPETAASLIVRFIDGGDNDAVLAAVPLIWSKERRTFNGRIGLACLPGGATPRGLRAEVSSTEVGEPSAVGAETIRRAAWRRSVWSLVESRKAHAFRALNERPSSPSVAAHHARAAMELLKEGDVRAQRLLEIWVAGLTTGLPAPTLSTAHTSGQLLPDVAAVVARPLLSEVLLASRLVFRT